MGGGISLACMNNRQIESSVSPMQGERTITAGVSESVHSCFPMISYRPFSACVQPPPGLSTRA